jgi:hypothetical protein
VGSSVISYLPWFLFILSCLRLGLLLHCWHKSILFTLPILLCVMSSSRLDDGTVWALFRLSSKIATHYFFSASETFLTIMYWLLHCYIFKMSPLLSSRVLYMYCYLLWTFLSCDLNLPRFCHILHPLISVSLADFSLCQNLETVMTGSCNIGGFILHCSIAWDTLS